MNLTRKSWENGWNPSQDRNGDPTALLRMDNLQIDEKGVLGLVRGFRQLGPDFSNYVSDTYSAIINGSEYLWISVGVGQEIKRCTINNPNALTDVILGGGTRPAFGNSLGQVYVCSGTQRKKDSADGTIRDLGLTTPTGAPTVNTVQQSKRDMGNSWVMTEGDKQEGEKIFVDKITLRAVSEAAQGDVNTLIIGTSASANPAKDRFYILLQPQDSSHFTNFRVELILDEDNYYWKDWPVDGNTFKLGIAQQTQLGCTRDEFIRQGSDSSKDWTSVSSIRVIATGITYDWFLASEPRFYGGSVGQLNGLYEYCTVNVRDNGVYQARTGPSPNSVPNLVFNGSAEVAPVGVDDQTTEVWFYRRSLPSGEFRQNLDGTPTSDVLVPLLNSFYRCGVTSGGSLSDTMGDTDVLLANIPLNPYLVSVKDITEPFICMEGLINERMLYVTASFIYVSDNLDPDAIDSRFTIKAFGDPTEQNYWLKKVSNSQLVLGTSKDLYEISGTFDETPDGFLDVNIHAVGEEYPPICQDVAVHSINAIGSLFYMASDGWRVTTGSNSALISPQLVKLFQGLSRYGVPAMAIYPGNVARYALAVGRNKLYCISQHVDGTRRLFVFDLLLKYWRLQYTDPVYILATKTDRILLGYGLSDIGTYNLVEMDFSIDGEVLRIGADHSYQSKGQGFNLETVLDDNGQPRNRKVTFTLKVVCDTGNLPVTVFIARNSINEPQNGAQDWIKLGDITCDGQTTNYFKLDGDGTNGTSNITKGFRYALKITNKEIVGVKIFKLYDYTIEYDPLPEQVNYLRIPPTNMGSYARKRWTAFAYVIDSLGHDVVFTPIVDNVRKTTSTVSSTEKLTRIHYFSDETVGTDIGGFLSSDHEFEFYGINNEESVSEKLPTPTTFLLIPSTDFGTPARKRFTSIKFSINTRGTSVRFTPLIDGLTGPSKTYTTSEKRTVEFFFGIDNLGDLKCIDLGWKLESVDGVSPFEFYGELKPEQIEVLPPRLLDFYIPTTNYGTVDRKRHTSYKFQIDTHGADVYFTPIVDGVQYASAIVNTTGRRLFEYFFDTSLDVKGIDIAGWLHTDTLTPFEFYQVITPQKIEVLPERLKSLYTPSTNYGVASKKRVRTIPYEIDSNGGTYTFTPVVDGIQLTPSTGNTSRKQTCFHYFNSDVFGVDYAAIITCDSSPFEFYGFGKPESVEVLPVGKLLDEVDILRFDKIGKLFNIRVRMITQTFETAIPWALYSDNQLMTGGLPTISGTITPEAWKDKVYEIPLPKSVNCSIARFVIGPSTLPFYRYDVQVRVSPSGMESDAQWRTLR